jgi:hypothetical protein
VTRYSKSGAGRFDLARRTSWGWILQYERFFCSLTHPDDDDELAMHLRNELTKLREKIKEQLGIYGVWNEPPLQGVPRSSVPSAVTV